MKRLTETAKWQDPWFRKLTSEQKLAYLYALDSCDSAGIFEPDEDLAAFLIGIRPDFCALAELMGERVQKLESGKWLLTRFVRFQESGAKPAAKRVSVKVERVDAPDDITVEALVGNPAYKHINVRAEFEKMRVWCAANKKHPTIRRFIVWLNRIEAPITTQAPRAVAITIPEPQGWRMWVARNYPDCVFLDEGNERFAKTWADLPSDMQRKFAAEMKYDNAA